MVGDPRKAHEMLGWHHHVTFDELVREMVESDLAAMQLERQGHARVE